MSPEGSARDWLRRAAGGDLLALQMLLVAHHERLHRLASDRMSGDLRAHLQPEDVVQQVYVRVLQAAGRIEDRGEQGFAAWLEAVLSSVVVDLERTLHAGKRDVRREVRPADSPTVYDHLAGKVADSLTPSRVAARGETRGILLAALAGLSSDHREVLELRYLRGMATGDVARAMGRTPGAVQMLCVRALRELGQSIRRLTLSWG